MKYRKLGDSDLEVSEISLGSWLTFGVGVEADKARSCLEEAFAQGINFIDTANVYGRGAAETFLGGALEGRPRDSFVLATKVYFPMSDSDSGLSRAQIEKQLEVSLRRLRTDYLDLYQCHRYDWDTPLEETMEALTRAVDSGKVRYIGFSEWPAERIQAALDMTGVARFVSSQPRYSLLDRHVEPSHVAFCRANGIGMIVYSPLAQGVLTDRYLTGIPEGSRASRPGSMSPDQLTEETMAKVRSLNEIAERRGQTLAQLALAWTLRDPRMTSTLIGASSVEQLDDSLGALDNLEIGDDELAEIDRYATDSDINLWARSSSE